VWQGSEWFAEALTTHWMTGHHKGITADVPKNLSGRQLSSGNQIQIQTKPSEQEANYEIHFMTESYTIGQT
jgi:hypothetical protein